MQTGQQPYPYSGKSLEGGGKISVGTTAVEVTFSIDTRSIIISADKDNTGTLYVGGSGVTSAGANAITYLSAGDTITLDYNDTTTALYVVASASSQNFWKGAIK
jgi:translation elongation factor EF-4